MERQEKGRRRPGREEAPLLVLIALAVLLVLLGFFIRGGQSLGSSGAVTTQTVAGATTTSVAPVSTVGATLTHPVRNPERIVIPAIGVDAPVVPVGLLENGDMETPDTGYAGWYSLGPAPGEPGPAVMLAHVDTRRKPDVFFHLKDLGAGDEVFVYGADDDPAVFVVESVEEELKIDLPRDRIWHYTSIPLIRLITCGGKWDSTSRHYLSNVIVYGHLVR